MSAGALEAGISRTKATIRRQQSELEAEQRRIREEEIRRAECFSTDVDEDDDRFAFVVSEAQSHHPPTQREQAVADMFDSGKEFEPIMTVPAAVTCMILSVLMIVMVFLIPMVCDPMADTLLHSGGHHDDQSGADDKHRCNIDSLSLLIYTHCIYWVAHLMVDPHLKALHKRHRINGYLDFYLHTKNVRRAPFYIVSAFNCLLLITMTVLHDYCDAHPGNCRDRFTKVDWLRGLITVECMVIMSLFGYYIIQINAFNRAEAKPDVMRPDFMAKLGSALILRPLLDEYNDDPADATRRPEDEVPANFGARLTAGDREDVLMLQAELIRFLVKQMRRKNRKIAILCTTTGVIYPTNRGGSYLVPAEDLSSLARLGSNSTEALSQALSQDEPGSEEAKA